MPEKTGKSIESLIDEHAARAIAARKKAELKHKPPSAEPQRRAGNPAWFERELAEKYARPPKPGTLAALQEASRTVAARLLAIGDEPSQWVRLRNSRVLGVFPRIAYVWVLEYREWLGHDDRNEWHVRSYQTGRGIGFTKGGTIVDLTYPRGRGLIVERIEAGKGAGELYVGDYRTHRYLDLLVSYAGDAIARRLTLGWRGTWHGASPWGRTFFSYLLLYFGLSKR